MKRQRHSKQLSIYGFLDPPRDEPPAKAQKTDEEPAHDPVFYNVIGFLDTHDWIQLSYTCRRINQFKYVQPLMIHKRRSMRKWEHSKGILRSFRAAKGTLFNVSFRGCHFVCCHYSSPLSGTIHTLDVSNSTAFEEMAPAHLTTLRNLCISPRKGPLEANCTFRALTGLTALSCVESSGSLSDATITRLRGLRALDITLNKKVTDAALAHLGNLEVLIMSQCQGGGITDAGLARLTNLHTLDISYCLQLTDAALQPLTRLRALTVKSCKQLTDAAFVNMKELRILNMTCCDQPELTDAVFEYMPNLRHLTIARCPQLTDAAFARLGRLRSLNMRSCTQPTITDAAFAGLTELRHLSLRACQQQTITSNAFRALGKLTWLDISCCSQKIKSVALRHTPNLRTLDISDTDHFTNTAFKELKHLTDLNLTRTSGHRISSSAFKSLGGLVKLKAHGCDHLMDNNLWGLKHLRELDVGMAWVRRTGDGPSRLNSLTTLRAGAFWGTAIKAGALVELRELRRVDCLPTDVDTADLGHLEKLVDIEHYNPARLDLVGFLRKNRKRYFDSTTQ
jgi:Leucine-rich repeat (LRR) protein